MNTIEKILMALVVVQFLRLVYDVKAFIAGERARALSHSFQLRAVDLYNAMSDKLGLRPLDATGRADVVLTLDAKEQAAAGDVLEGFFTIEECGSYGMEHWHVLSPDGDRVGGAYTTEAAALEVADMLNSGVHKH